LVKDLEVDFQKYITINFRNYPVDDAYLPHGVPVKLEVKNL
jgi:formylmethanofuran dehydrogenase subunit A